MKPAFRKILIGLGIILLAFAIIVSLRPGDFRVARSAEINALPAAVFPHINNLHRWNDWSPWAKLDPNAKYTVEGPPEGRDASMRWAGNANVGEGRMSIVDSRPSEFVRFKLEFFKPMAGTCDATFELKPAGERTQVTWSMSGKNNFIAKAIGLFVNCDKMMGEQFEQGLTNLKSIVESDAK